MVTNSDTFKKKLPVCFRYKDQTEIRGPAANITDKDHVSHVYLVSPGIHCGLDPGVKGGLWFF